MVERDLRMLDRRTHIAALAAALRVSETELTGQPYMDAANGAGGAHATIPGLQTALSTNTLGDSMVERARPLPILRQLVDGEVTALRKRCDYATLGSVLPDIVDEVHFHVATAPDEAAYAAALRLLVDVSHPAAAMSATLGYPDLARLAVRHGMDAARELDDPAYRGLADFFHVMTVPRAGAWGRVLRLSEQAADRFAPHLADDADIQVLGMLHLTAAFSAAADPYKADDADAHLAEADALAARVPDGADAHGLAFNRANVGVWRVTITAERGEYSKAVDLARRLDVSVLSQNRQAQFYVEVARAMAHLKDRSGEAVAVMRRAEKTAPQRVRNSPAARQTVSHLLSRVRTETGSRELRGLASRMKIPH